MTNHAKDVAEIARHTAEGILEDLCSRSGMGGWDEDAELWAEIVRDTASAVTGAVNAATAPLREEIGKLRSAIEFLRYIASTPVQSEVVMRDEAYERAAIVAEGMSMARNQPFPHSGTAGLPDKVCDLIAERDAAIAAAIRSLKGDHT